MSSTISVRRPRICMIVQQRDVKGGIAAVVEGYYDSSLEDRYDIRYVESYCDGSAFKKLIKAIKGYFEFWRVLKKFRPEAVHMHSSFGPSFYRMQPFLFMAKRRHIPVIDHCHGADFDTFYVNAGDRKKNRVKKVFGQFDKVIVLSDEWRDRFAGIIPGDRIVVLNNYCKAKDLSLVKDSFDSRFDRKQVVFLGEIGQRKGGFDFAEIIRKTADKIPGVKFMICGDGSREDVETIKSEIKTKCSDVQVFFPGWVRGDKKDEILMESAVFMLPSYQEGQPMSILDAMAYGLPIISTNVGGIPQQVDNGYNGYLTAPGDTDTMADSMASILGDRDRFIEMSEHSYLVADKKYGFDTHINKLMKVYDSVLG